MDFLKFLRRSSEKDRDELILSASPEQGMEVLSSMSDLRDLLAEFDTKVEAILYKNERDYLSVYDAHSGKLNQELANMRQKLSSVDKVSTRSNHIEHLRSETKWFSSEAIRLSSLCKSHKRSLLKWRAVTLSLEDEKIFLEKLHTKMTNRMKQLDARGRSLVEYSERVLEQPREQGELTRDLTGHELFEIDEKLEKAKSVEEEISRIEVEIALLKRNSSPGSEENAVTSYFRQLVSEHQVKGKRLTNTDYMQIMKSLLLNPDVLTAISK